MAKIKFGMMMTDARGKLGGQVFSKNNAGNYVRTKVTPNNPQSIAQSSARALFSAISQQWSGLTQAVRDSFDAAVADWARTDIFGDLRNPTGKNLFQRLNNQAQSAGLSPVVTVPAKLTMPDDIVTSVVIAIGAGTLTLTGANTSASTQIMLSATPSLTQGTKFVKNRLAVITNFAGDSAVPADEYTAYTNKYGVPTAGDNIYVGIKYVLASGQASPLQIVKASVTA